MELWTIAQTAEFLKVSYDQLWNMLDRGDPHPPYIMVGKRKRFIRSQVEQWVSEQTVTPAPVPAA